MSKGHMEAIAALKALRAKSSTKPATANRPRVHASGKQKARKKAKA